LSSFRTCSINFENRESALAAKHDLDSNPDIRVDLKWKVYPVNKVDPEKVGMQQAKKLKRKIMKVDANSEDPPKKKGKLSITASGTILPNKQNLNGSPKIERSV
jgi:hypothetical protein